MPTAPSPTSNGTLPAAPERPRVEHPVYQQLFDRETLADYLRLSTDTLDRLIKARKLGCVRIGSQIRFTAEDVDMFLKRNRLVDPAP